MNKIFADIKERICTFMFLNKNSIKLVAKKKFIYLLFQRTARESLDRLAASSDSTKIQI